MTQVPRGPTRHPAPPEVRVEPKSEPPIAPFDGDVEGWIRSGRWQTVTSSNVRAIAYDADEKLLKFMFLSGAKWQYGPFGVEMARRCYLAGSKGEFLNNHIKVRGKGNAGKHQCPIAAPF